MASVTTTASILRQYNAFTGLSATERSQSGIARAELVYYCVNEDWPAPGAGNRRLFQTGSIDLPKDFGYVVTDAFLYVRDPTNTTCDAEGVAQLRLQPGGSLGPQIYTTLVSDAGRQDSLGNTAIGSIAASNYNSVAPSIEGEDASITYHLRDKPTALLYPFASQTYTSTPNPATTFDLAVGEQKLNGAAYKVSLYLRFLQYDIDQSYNYVLQSPQLTR